MKAVVAAFNQEKALVGTFSVITNLRMELFGALVQALAQLRTTLGRGRSSSSTKAGREESVSWTIVTRATLLWLLLALKIALVAVDTHTETEAASTADYLYYSISILVLLLNLSIQVIGCCVVRV